jgi:hypothetical protein
MRGSCPEIKQEKVDPSATKDMALAPSVENGQKLLLPW